MRNPFHNANRTEVTVSLDTEVLDWLTSGGKGYRAKLNAILRRAMIEERSKLRAADLKAASRGGG